MKPFSYKSGSKPFLIFCKYNAKPPNLFTESTKNGKKDAFL